MGQIQFVGDIFFRLVQMGIVPFVILAIVEAVGGLTARDLSGLGAKGIAWFAVSSVLAAAFGTLMAVALSPARGLRPPILFETPPLMRRRRAPLGRMPSSGSSVPMSLRP